MGIPFLKIINTNQGYIQKYEDLKMVVLVKLFTISKDGSVVSFSGPPIMAQRYYKRVSLALHLMQCQRQRQRVGNKKVTSICNPPYQRIHSVAGISCQRQQVASHVACAAAWTNHNTATSLCLFNLCAFVCCFSRSLFIWFHFCCGTAVSYVYRKIQGFVVTDFILHIHVLMGFMHLRKMWHSVGVVEVMFLAHMLDVTHHFIVRISSFCIWLHMYITGALFCFQWSMDSRYRNCYASGCMLQKATMRKLKILLHKWDSRKVICRL